MLEKIQALEAEINAFDFSGKDSLEIFKQRYVGKKGAINSLFEAFKETPSADKAAVGQALNRLKQTGGEKLQAAQARLIDASFVERPRDPTLPAAPYRFGGLHPVTLIEEKVVSVFEKLGFVVADGPEIEDDYHNFGALNFEDDHPARDMQDTFFVQGGKLLRTHTSNVQVRVMEKQKPPIRILAPGRVYRNETVTARSHCYFHQIELLCIDENVSFADLKQTLYFFTKQFFGPEIEIRLRASYFPFTEISAELDITCLLCKGDGCPVCKHSGWVEILGCGMVDPNVLENCGIDPDKYSGYALGMGIERLALVLYRIPDIRLYSQNDLRFLSLFRSIV